MLKLMMVSRVAITFEHIIKAGGNLIKMTEELLAQISVIVTQKNNSPAVELRMNTTNSDLLKKIVQCAFHSRPIILMPVFNDKVKSIGSLIEKGILYVKKGEYYFNI